MQVLWEWDLKSMEPMLLSKINCVGFLEDNAVVYSLDMLVQFTRRRDRCYADTSDEKHKCQSLQLASTYKKGRRDWRLCTLYKDVSISTDPVLKALNQILNETVTMI